MGVKRKDLSGLNYVAAWFRDTDEEATNQWRGVLRIPIRKPDNCNHAESICTKWDCVELWAIDYHLYLGRTAGGRSIADTLGIPADVDINSQPGRYVSHAEYLARFAPVVATAAD
jgi:hypothetical protein